MLDLGFRRMTKADLPVVTRIENDCQSHPWSTLQFLDGFNAGHEGWLASREIGERELVVGFAIIASVLDERSLLNLCVRQAFQNRGYGRALLAFLLDRARQENVERVFLEVRASNSPAIHLYESMGFQQVSMRRAYYPANDGREDGFVYSFSPLS